MQRYSALGFGMSEGHLKSDRMHAGYCAIITTAMEAGCFCNAEKQEHLHPLSNHGEIRHYILPSLDASFGQCANTSGVYKGKSR